MKGCISVISNKPFDSRLRGHTGEKVLIETDADNIAEDSPPFMAVRIKFLEGTDKGMLLVVDVRNLETEQILQPISELPFRKQIYYKTYSLKNCYWRLP